MYRLFIITLTILTIFLVINIANAQVSPYRGFERREIKSLSQEQVQGYLEGEGMEMALAAELNNYPGPKHCLELKDSLKVTPEQEEQIQAIFNGMHEETVKLGKSIVEKEKELDQLFASGKITENSLASLISRISDLNGRLRFEHLRAHLKTVELLDSTQIEKYNQQRGYGEKYLHSPHKHGEHSRK